MDHLKVSALSSRNTIIKSDRGVAFQSHPNMKISASDHSNSRSNDDSRTNSDCKQKNSKMMIFIFFISFFLMEWSLDTWHDDNPSEKRILQDKQETNVDKFFIINIMSKMRIFWWANVENNSLFNIFTFAYRNHI